jgi:hypothetical protein
MAINLFEAARYPDSVRSQLGEHEHIQLGFRPCHYVVSKLWSLYKMSRHDKVDVREQTFYAVLTPFSLGGRNLSG